MEKKSSTPHSRPGVDSSTNGSFNESSLRRYDFQRFFIYYIHLYTMAISKKNRGMTCEYFWTFHILRSTDIGFLNMVHVAETSRTQPARTGAGPGLEPWGASWTRRVSPPDRYCSFHSSHDTVGSVAIPNIMEVHEWILSHPFEGTMEFQIL